MASELPNLSAEWMETDGLGGFASGTVGGFRTRRYYALLLIAQKPPTDRLVLVNGFETEVETRSVTMRCRNRGGVWERDSVYHQGTVWLWLMGGRLWRRGFACGGTLPKSSEKPAGVFCPPSPHIGNLRFGTPLRGCRCRAAHTPRGCPFQAWSLGEFLRLDRQVLAESNHTTGVSGTVRDGELQRSAKSSST